MTHVMFLKRGQSQTLFTLRFIKKLHFSIKIYLFIFIMEWRSSSRKRIKPTCIEESEVVGPFPIIVKYQPYYVCAENRLKITKSLIKWVCHVKTHA